MKLFLESLLYGVLSLSHAWMVLASVLLLLRRRKLRASGRSAERRIYQAIIAVSLLVWAWNGFRPTPVLFEERVGLYWGLKTDNASWGIEVDERRRRSADAPAIAHNGGSSLAVRFERRAGWVIFNHFPTAPPISRYESMQFYVDRSDLKSDSLRVVLLSDGKKRHPSEGLPVGDRYRCPSKSTTWDCYRLPLADFGHPGGGIIGVGIGKSSGTETGTFHLDDVRLISKSGPRHIHQSGMINNAT